MARLSLVLVHKQEKESLRIRREFRYKAYGTRYNTCL